MGFAKQPNLRYALELLIKYVKERSYLTWDEHVEAQQAYEFLAEEIGRLEHYKVKVMKDNEREQQKRQLERMAAEADKRAKAKEDKIEEAPAEDEPEAEQQPEPAEQQPIEPTEQEPQEPQVIAPPPRVEGIDSTQNKAAIAAMEAARQRALRKTEQPPAPDPRSPRR